MNEKKIISILRRSGPMTGEELLRLTDEDVFRLWQACRKSPWVVSRRVGRRFLRLDRAVEGYARLSPSIRREFQTYTMLGLKDQMVRIEELTRRLVLEIRRISSYKCNLARRTVTSVMNSLKTRELIREQACFIIAGDVTYDMAHSVPRPERSTGKIVRGSDLDLIVVVDDAVSRSVFEELDDAIHTRKYYLLVHPAYREEIDYVIKPLSLLREQLRFDTFEAMVACKILREGELLCGSAALFQGVKGLLAEDRIPERLDLLEDQAWKYRRRAEEYLRDLDADPGESEFSNLFFTREERLEEIDNGRGRITGTDEVIRGLNPSDRSQGLG